LTTNAKQPVPIGFIEDAPRYHMSELCRRYRVGHTAVERWCRETGVTVAKAPKRTHDLPDDFRDVGVTMTVTDLMRHYRVSHGVIDRWVKLTGITPPKDSHVARAARWKAIVERRKKLTPEQIEAVEDEPFRLTDENWRQWARQWGPVFRALAVQITEPTTETADA